MEDVTLIDREDRSDDEVAAEVVGILDASPAAARE